jgi:hypothetical protein
LVWNVGGRTEIEDKFDIWYDVIYDIANISASYSGGLGFKSQHGDRLSRLRIFVVYLDMSRQIPEFCLK